MGLVEVEVNVTADDVVLGGRRDDTGCPVALALHRLGLAHARVEHERAALLPGVAVTLPPDVVDWVRRFDEGRGVWPISFVVQVPKDAFKADADNPWAVAASQQLEAVRQWMSPFVADAIARSRLLRR